jgi:hypothetical protein
MSTLDSDSDGKPATKADSQRSGGNPPGRPRPRRKAQGRKADKSERSNKKADLIAMMKRAKGVMLAEIMAAIAWQTHTVRGPIEDVCNNSARR